MPDTPVIQKQAAQNQTVASTPLTASPGALPTDNKTVFLPVTADGAKQSSPETLNASLQKPVVTPAVNTPQTNTTAGNTLPANTAPANTKPAEPKALVISNPQPQATNGASSEPAKELGPMDVGSLIAYATKQTAPVYPIAAKSIRATGVVRVEVTVDEKGDVADVQRASGPTLLQSAAKDAIKKWRFKPFVRDGQPVKAVGFVNFNFSL
jgi:TonB family protein